MKVLNNIKMCFFWDDYWENEMTAKAFGEESFLKAYCKDEYLYNPWREGRLHIYDPGRPKRYQLKYDDINKHKKIETLDELYLLTEANEQNFQCGFASVLSRILKYKNKKVLVTNLTEYSIEILESLNIDYYTKKECDRLFVDRIFLIKNLWFEENILSSVAPGMDFFTIDEDALFIQKKIKKKNVVFFRQDPITGIDRVMVNYSEVRELFKKYGFVIRDKFADLTIYEKKIYLNSFENIFIEGGAGNFNLFLLNPNKKAKIFLLDPPHYDSSFLFDFFSYLDYVRLDVGELVESKDTPADPMNLKWKIDLPKLEIILKESLK
jgi:hypothetical protein|tara:strand:- start:375 stop:1343 length:969 start_codon:yes stop_codon:yes gene_type:complete